VWLNEITLSPSQSSKAVDGFDSVFSSSTLHPCHFTNFSRVKFYVQQFAGSGQNRNMRMREIQVLSFSVVRGS